MNSQIQLVVETLGRNKFTKLPDGSYYNNLCKVTIHKDHYQVTHYEEAFLEHMDWFSPDLMIYTLMGYLSWNDFIRRGYEK